MSAWLLIAGVPFFWPLQESLLDVASNIMQNTGVYVWPLFFFSAYVRSCIDTTAVQRGDRECDSWHSKRVNHSFFSNLRRHGCLGFALFYVVLSRYVLW